MSLSRTEQKRAVFAFVIETFIMEKQELLTGYHEGSPKSMEQTGALANLPPAVV